MKQYQISSSSQNLIQGIGIALTFLIILMAGLAIYHLKNNAINEWSKELENLTLVVSDHAHQTIFSAEVALEGIDELISKSSLKDENSFKKFASKKETYQLLVDRQISNPIIDVISLVDVQGNVINFTRSFPPPPINLSDRDYYKWHVSQDSPDHFYSLPVQNRGNGKWVFYISRRVNNAQGELIGLILVGVSIEMFSNIYERLGKNLGEGASISLYRRDFTLLTRWPLKEQLIGQKNTSSATKVMIEDKKLNHGVMVTESPRFTNNNEPIKRMVATRLLEKYPFLISIVATEDLYLSSWRKSTLWTSITALVSIVILMTLIRFLFISNQKVNAELSERIEAQKQLALAHSDLEQRIQERTKELRDEVTQRKQAQDDLAAINSQIAKISHQAGMAEVANSMLHNIGNVLNSLNVATAVLRTQLNQSPLNQLPDIVRLIEDNKRDLANYLSKDAVGSHIPELLKLMSEQAKAEQINFIKETNQIYSSVQHINEIIDKQKSYSGRVGVIESFKVSDFINEALSFYKVGFDKAGIKIKLQIPEGLMWIGDKNKIMQIMVNLIVNAKDSMKSYQAQLAEQNQQFYEGELTITASVNEGASHLFLEVIDNGSGIAPEIQKKIFNYGFTTKETGHGFGLHGSALAAQEMGGELIVRSDGLGQGATFVLSLPKHQVIAS